MSNVDDITFLTRQELAKRWRVGVRTIENWVKSGKCPAPFKISKKISLWRLEDVVELELEWRAKCGMK